MQQKGEKWPILDHHKHHLAYHPAAGQRNMGSLGTTVNPLQEKCRGCREGFWLEEGWSCRGVRSKRKGPIEEAEREDE